jgi:hypothetical protein
MAFAYQSKTWEVQGVKEFENSFSLLNPEIVVNQVVINGENIFLTLNIKENGGVFNHSYNIQYANGDGVTDIDSVVDSAIAAAFPSATLKA